MATSTLVVDRAVDPTIGLVDTLFWGVFPVHLGSVRTVLWFRATGVRRPMPVFGLWAFRPLYLVLLGLFAVSFTTCADPPPRGRPTESNGRYYVASAGKLRPVTKATFYRRTRDQGRRGGNDDIVFG